MTELHHYIGTGLEIQLEDNEGVLRTATLDGIYDHGTSVAYQYNAHHSGNRQFSDEIKPIMYPLEALAEPIRVESYNEGKEFVPAKQNILESYDFSGISIYVGYDYGAVELSFDDINQWPFDLIKQLISWHFWIGDQSLFKTGAIIDKRTIKPTTK